MQYDPENLHLPGNDEFVLSKGHAAPILYAAYAEAGAVDNKDLDTLRKFESPLEGHPVPRVPGVRAATGSLGQGISIGAGMAFAMRMDGRKNKAFVLLGDGEMAEGNVWEAMNFSSFYKLDNLYALVDVNRLGQSGPTMFGWDVNEYAARARAFGWNTVTVDGHSVSELVEALDEEPSNGRPTMIVARTVKGKLGGATEDQEGRHGKPLPDEEYEEIISDLESKIEKVEYSPENLIRLGSVEPPEQTGRVSVTADYTVGEKEATRTAFGKGLEKIGRQDPAAVVLDGDVKNSSRTKFFFDSFPERSLECYIAEQNMLGVAAGLQSQGKHVFLASFAAFLTRAHDQFRMAAYSRADMTVAGSHTGVSIGEDGPSQMGLEDIAMMRSLFGSVVVSPSDAVSAEKLTAECANMPGISYIRTIRGKTPVLYGNGEEFPIGGAKILKQSSSDHAAVIATGYTVHQALEAVKAFQEQNVGIRLIDCYSLKPVDEETILKAAADTGIVIVAEDHFPEGGLGETVARIVSGRASVHHLAVHRMPHSGDTDKLLAEQGIDTAGIIAKLKECLGMTAEIRSLKK
jgi:transketolase